MCFALASETNLAKRLSYNNSFYLKRLNQLLTTWTNIFPKLIFFTLLQVIKSIDANFSSPSLKTTSPIVTTSIKTIQMKRHTWEEEETSTSCRQNRLENHRESCSLTNERSNSMIMSFWQSTSVYSNNPLWITDCEELEINCFVDPESFDDARLKILHGTSE